MPDSPAITSTVYLEHVFNMKMFPQTVSSTLDKAREMLNGKYPFDTIAFCGISGAAMAFILSHHLNISLLCVRKKNEQSHYRRQRPGTLLEGNVNARRYIIVDDFISSGETVDTMINTIANEIVAECVAILLYSGYDYNSNRPHPFTENLLIPVITSKI